METGKEWEMLMSERGGEFQNCQTLSIQRIIKKLGMNENVKVDLRISRKQLLLLSQVMERGIHQQKTEATGLLSAMPENASTDLLDVIKECLDKAGLTDLNEKLRSLAISAKK